MKQTCVCLANCTLYMYMYVVSQRLKYEHVFLIAITRRVSFEHAWGHQAQTESGMVTIIPVATSIALSITSAAHKFTVCVTTTAELNLSDNR